MSHTQNMRYAKVEWREINNKILPYSLDFNDVYFNSENGLAETEYVFIAQNKLKERFAALKNNEFTIIETGFGTGLNFYCAATHFFALAPADATLRYISIEKFPLTPNDMQKIATLWSQFAGVSGEFLAQYVNIKPGPNHIHIAGKQILTELRIDHVSNAMPQISHKADAWFLDGFAPAKNSEMWSNDVFKHIARLSKPETTFATFTSAGAVRRGLLSAGFEVQKRTGFGKKREMLSGIFKS